MAKFVMIGTLFCIRLKDLVYVARNKNKIFVVYDIEQLKEGKIRETQVFDYKTEDEAEDVMCDLAEEIAIANERK